MKKTISSIICAVLLVCLICTTASAAKYENKEIGISFTEPGDGYTSYTYDEKTPTYLKDDMTAGITMSASYEDGTFSDEYKDIKDVPDEEIESAMSDLEAYFDDVSVERSTLSGKNCIAIDADAYIGYVTLHNGYTISIAMTSYDGETALTEDDKADFTSLINSLKFTAGTGVPVTDPDETDPDETDEPETDEPETDEPETNDPDETDAVETDEDGNVISKETKKDKENKDDDDEDSESGGFMTWVEDNLILVIVGIAAVVVIIAVVIIICVLAGKKKKAAASVAPAAAPQQPIQPVAPTAPQQPIQPVAPVAPQQPVQPVAPAAPQQPVQPVAPAAPAAEPQPVQPAEPAAEPQQPTASVCPACGTPHAPGAAFCQNCGQKLN